MSEYIVEFGDRPINDDNEYIHERVVRCRDCKDYRESDETCHSWQWHNWDAPIEVEPDGFCAWGERRQS